MTDTVTVPRELLRDAIAEMDMYVSGYAFLLRFFRSASPNDPRHAPRIAELRRIAGLDE